MLRYDENQLLGVSMDQKGLWQAALGELEVTLTRANFSTWFRDTAILSSEDGHVTIAVPHPMAKKWLSEKFHEDIKATLTKMDATIRTIDYKIGRVPNGGGQAATEAGQTKTHRPAQANQASLPIASSASTASHNLNPRYTFESFVVGASK
jgi:chromosomal replication initiator protein